jgi:hypothetical protein
MGDCAVTGNVPSLRNPFGPEKILQHVYCMCKYSMLPEPLSMNVSAKETP